MNVRCLLVFLFAFVSALLLPAAGQASSDAFKSRLRYGQSAMEAGDAKGAAIHLQRALSLQPDSQEVLRLLFENARDDAAARRLWALELWNASCDSKGKASGKKELLAEVLRVAPTAEAMAAARVASVKELVKLCAAERKKASKSPAAGLVAHWLRDLALDVARPIPALAAAHAKELDFEYEVSRRHIDAVIKNLKSVHSRCAATSDYPNAIRAARILRGLSAQGMFKDLQGPTPVGVAALERWSLEALEKSRTAWRRKEGAPLTVAQLEGMDEEESREFSSQHADQSFPGAAISPKGAYRIETSCGYETLLGVAETVERHHQRLVNWYGSDPFEGRPGLMRILPEAAGLESEGAPFWWVGGFQSGDTTTLRFNCGTIEGLGHLIVHELTHRFDGALYPGTPAWLAEGKAVWTGGSFESSYSEEFVESHIEFGTVESAWIKGYGAEEKLQELIEGEIEEYRDNYVAGYALFVFLKLWREEDGSEPYSGNLERYMEGLSRQQKRGGLEWFVSNFADGKDGRPSDFKAFAAAFAEFMAGFYWDNRADWTSNYTASIDQVRGAWVYDAQTWTWSRNRAEPWWGQDHAWRAGSFFLELDKKQEALDAYLWAWSVDEKSPAHSMQLANLLEDRGKAEAAWVLRNTAIRQAWSGNESNTALPLPLALPKTLLLLEALGSEVDHIESMKGSFVAAAFAAEEARLAGRLGQEVAKPALVIGKDMGLHPLDEPARQLGLMGWTEDGLTGFEERRVEDCWYVEADGDLHVGRSKPRDTSGSLDRTAHSRHAFALSERKLLAGRYELRCKIQLTTSFADGVLVLGYQRRDRQLRLHFSAGDLFYSIGKKEEAEELDKVNWSVSGLRERDQALAGSVRSGEVAFDSPRTSFELKAIVDGSAAYFWIEDRYLGAYHDALGTPISGRIGFATRRGAIRVGDPTIQRLDRSQELGLPLSEEGAELLVEAGLDPQAPTPASFRTLVGRPVRGIDPGACGTMLVWIPVLRYVEEESEVCFDESVVRALKLARSTRKMLEVTGANQPILVMVPDKLGEERLAKIRTGLAEDLGEFKWSLETYPWELPSSEIEVDLASQHRSWLMFVDSASVLRFCDRFYGFGRSFPEELMHWITVFRDNAGEF
ncbi:MAG: hypothetical protein ACI8X5_000782 [Planctomycetota bacterium]|jgi:hypothetical protein